MEMMAKFLCLLTALTITPWTAETRRLEIPSRVEVAEGDIIYLNDTIFDLIQDTEKIDPIATDVDEIWTSLDSLTTNVDSMTEQLNTVSDFVDQLNARAELASTVNIALHKPVRANSEWDANYGAHKAVDGSPSLNSNNHVCFASGYYDQWPWWQIDLQGKYVISEVHVFARDDCCPERLRDIYIRVADTPEATSADKACASNNTQAGWGEKLIMITACPDKPIGQYVTIEAGYRAYPSGDPFAFCEVQIYS